MATVEKGNVVLTVNDEEIDRYLSMGYNVIDEQGKVVKACVPTDLGALRAAYVSHTETIKRQQAEIEELKARLNGGTVPPETDPENPDMDGRRSRGGKKAKEANEE